MTKQQHVRGAWNSLPGALFVALFSLSAFAEPPNVREEVATVAPPESRFPLNGQLALRLPLLVAGSSIMEGGVRRSAAFVFERGSASAWSPGRKLDEFETIDAHFSVDVDAQTAAVAMNGAAHVYELVAGTWRRTATLTPPSTASDFGSDIAISADHLAVGGVSEGRFASYVYRRNAAGQWTLSARLLAGLTWSVAGVIGPVLDITHASPNSEPTPRVAIASPNHQPGSTETGAIYVYKLDEEGAWVLAETIPGFLETRPGRMQIEIEDLIASTWTPPLFAISFEMEPDSYVSERVDLPVDLFMNGPPASLAVHGLNVAVGEPGNEDRGAKSGSVTVHWRKTLEDPPILARVKLYASDARSGLELGRMVAYDGSVVAAGSRDRVYIFDVPNLTEAPPETVQEDFEDGIADGWSGRASDWSVVTADGSRVFRQRGNGGTPFALLTAVDWTNQSVQADIRPRAFNGSGVWAGLVLRYLDDDNYYYVALSNANRIDIVRRVNGVNMRLASTPFTVSTSRSYRVRFEVVGSWLRVYVDAARVVQARDATFAHGTLGLMTAWTRADFDNVVVSPNPLLVLLYDDFQDGDVAGWRLEPPDHWANVALGSRVLRQSVAPGVSTATAGVRVSWFRPELSPQIIEARVKPLSFLPGEDSWVGLFVRHSDIFVTLNRTGGVSLRRREAGFVHTIATAPLTVTAGTSRQVRLEAIGTHLRVYVDGRFVLAGFDTTDPSQQELRSDYGLITSGAQAEFDNVRVTWP